MRAREGGPRCGAVSTISQSRNKDYCNSPCREIPLNCDGADCWRCTWTKSRARTEYFPARMQLPVASETCRAGQGGEAQAKGQAPAVRRARALNTPPFKPRSSAMSRRSRVSVAADRRHFGVRSSVAARRGAFSAVVLLALSTQERPRAWRAAPRRPARRRPCPRAGARLGACEVASGELRLPKATCCGTRTASVGE